MLTKCIGWYSGGAPDVSYTWVDATIERPPGRDVLGTLSVKCNDAGTQEFRVHKRRWILQSQKVQRVWHDLRPGDVVQMIPRANYPGWACLVREAGIKIGYRPKRPQNIAQSDGQSSLSSEEKLGLPIYPYRLDNLDSKNYKVRLLVVRPAPVLDDPIVCSLITTRLSPEQKFDALSYCWGAGHSKKMLTINGQSVLVSSSVVAALRQLRHKDQDLTIWIDQICVNQCDVDERDEQVRLMAEIYSSAARVHVWLGEGDVATWTALRIVRDSFNMNRQICPGGAAACICDGLTPHSLHVEAFRARHQAGGNKPSFKFMHEVFFAHVKNEPGELAEAAGAANNLQLTTLMSTLYINPWFRRVWVLQEALLARKALVHCGTEVVPWREVQRVSDWLATIHQPLYHAPHITMPHVWGLLKSPEAGHVPEQELLDVFMHGLEMRATDPRDKLFALLSFAKGTGKGTEVPLPIQSSYKKPLEKVFADFTVWWIRENQSLSILSCIHGHRDRTWQRLHYEGREKPSLPSPSWTIGYEGQGKWARITLDAQFQGSRASANTVPDEELLNRALSNPNDLSLQLRGFEVTSIKEIFHLSLAEYSTPLIKPARKLIQVFDILLDPCGRHRTWNSKFKGLNWTRPPSISADRLKQEIDDHANTHSCWEQYQGQPSQPALRIPRGMSGGVVADKQLETEGTNTSMPTCVDPFLFEAENGAVGICPWMAEKGDVVVILHGAKVPYLLRPQMNSGFEEGGQRFEFVGECFLMGAMNGNWFEKQVEEGVEPRMFTLI